MRVLVTGGAGFIGRAVVDHLTESGHHVVVADLIRPRNTTPDVEVVQGDLRDGAVVERALAPGTDAVVHLAAATSVLRSVRQPDDVYTTNVAMTHSLLERCRLLGVGRFVLASTNAVVGSGAGAGPITEESPLLPLTPYGATKAAGEMLMSAYRSSYGLAAVALRLTNVYGPGIEVKDGMVARLMKAALTGHSVNIYGDGLQVRDYVYMADVVGAVAAALAADLPARLIVGSGCSVSVLDLHRMVCEASGVDIPYVHAEPQAGEMRAVVVDRSAAEAVGLGPPTPLTTGLDRTWEAFAAATARPR